MTGEIVTPILAAIGTAIGATLAAWLAARVRSGRFMRTIEHAAKFMEFVERYTTQRQAVAAFPDPIKSEMESSLAVALKAVQEDFAAERAQLNQFHQSTLALRQAFLFVLPKRAILYAPFLFYHIALLALTYIVVLRAIQKHQPSDGDVGAFLLACLVILAARVTYAKLPRWTQHAREEPAS